MNWIIAVVAVVASVDVAQRAHTLRAAPAAHRQVVAFALVGIAVVLAFAATPLLDTLDVSAPTMEVGAGLVLAVYSAFALARWDDRPAPPAIAGGFVPLLFPIVLTPMVATTVLAVAARNGWWLPLVAVAPCAAAVGWRAIGTRVATRSWRVLSATAGAVTGVALITDGALAV